MAIGYRPCEPQQVMLRPVSLQDWLPEGHLAHIISDTVDVLDRSLSESMCARHGMNATQDEDRCGGPSGAAADSG